MILQKRRNKGNYCRGKKETSHTEQGRVKCNGERLRERIEKVERKRERERGRGRSLFHGREHFPFEEDRKVAANFRHLPPPVALFTL